jgi:biotin carboxyl carrier protein
MDTTRMAIIDIGVLIHQLPGGMTTNLVAQLREADALDRIDEIYQELPRVRRELGYPPLVTPTSQIVGIQAIQNVLFGRYKMISSQVKDYVYGLYGKPPVPIDPEIQKIILSDYERGDTPITYRAADILEPELEKSTEATKGIARDIGDVLTYALYPITGMRFLRWKYGLETPPPEVKAKTLEDVRHEDELIAEIKSGKWKEKHPPPGETNVRVKATEASPIQGQVAEPPAEIKTGEGAILAPMPGVVIRYEVEVGDEVKAGDTIVILEAMKMDNAVPTPISGRVKAIYFTSGDHVDRDDVLAEIG